MDLTIEADDFKTFFDRGQFSYGDVVPDVRDKDITEAISEATNVMNSDLYPDEATGIKAKLYLSAHFLKLDIDLSDSGGQPNFIQTSRSADGISESLSIPSWMMEGDFAQFATTSFGQKFLTLSKPYLDGAVYCVEGGTTP